MKLDSNIYEVKKACLIHEWLLPFTYFWSHVPLINFKTIFAHLITSNLLEYRYEM